MKKKVLAISILTIVLCMSLIAGAVMALFTSESKVNIAVSSGTVDVQATIVRTTTYSMGTATAQNGTFENGGTASVDGSSIVLDRMTPGDKLVVEISIANTSNVAYAQRFTMAASGDQALQQQLLFGVSAATTSGTEGTYTYYNNFTSAWEKDAAASQTRYIVIELPEYAGNSAQGKSCAFVLTVEAVQGNADTSAAATESCVYIVDATTNLESTISNLKDGETLVLGGSAETWASQNVSISFNDSKTINVCGYKVGSLTINAQYGTVNVYNDAGSITATSVAGNSLHVYGNVDTLTVNSGRAVVEAGASVGTVVAKPSESSNATVEIVLGASVEAISVDTSATNSSTNLVIEEGVAVPDVDVSGGGDVEMSGREIDTQEELVFALQVGGTIDLAGDIETSQQLVIPEGVSAILNLNGYDIAGSNAGTLICNRGTLTINDTNADGVTDTGCVYTTDLEAQGRHVLENYGTMIVNNGTFGDSDTDRENANGVNRGNAVRNYNTMTINGGYFTACDNYTKGGYAYVFASGPIESGEASLTIENAHAYGRTNGLISSDGGLVTVNDGSYTLGYGTETNLWRIVYTSNDGEVVLNGGTYTRNANNDIAFFGASGTGSITVNDGTFADLIHDHIRVDGNAPTIIKGGTLDAGFSGEMVQDERTEFFVSGAAELRYIAQLVNGGDTFAGKTITLTADIDLENIEWTPIGYNGSLFAGTFDGNEKTITGLNVDNGKVKYAGLFGLAAYATLKNVTIADASVVSAGNAVGILVGGMIKSTVENVTVSGSVKGVYYTGGVIGCIIHEDITVSGGAINEDITVTGCINWATVNGEQQAGGIVGTAYNAGGNTKIVNCINNGAVTDNSGYGAGGIVGFLSGYDDSVDHLAPTIENCVNHGTITGSNRAGGIAGALGIEGGMGYYELIANIIGCTNDGTVSGTTAGDICVATVNYSGVETSNLTIVIQ